MTDVWTSVGVVVGVALVAVTGWLPLDSIVALAVAANILVTGARLAWTSGSALLDASMPAGDVARVCAVLDSFRSDTVDFHGLQTRESGRARFVSVHVLVPGAWSVQRAHDLVEVVEAALRAELDHLDVSTHIEPREDARSYADHGYDATHRDD
jgi:cation diffusion facilitator family transporter